MPSHEPPNQQERIDQLLREAGRQDVIDWRHNGTETEDQITRRLRQRPDPLTKPYACTPTDPCGHCDLCIDPDWDEGEDDEQSPASSWAPVDLTSAIAGEDIPAPELWERTDGIRLIYAGRIHWFQGESESCKSWAAQVVTATELAAQHDVLYIDFEDEARGVITRLRSLGATTSTLTDHLTYIRPDEPLRDRQQRYTDAWTDLAEVLQHPYQLCIIDGVTEAMTTEALNLLDNTDIAAWMRLIPKRIAALGTAVICIDHVVKTIAPGGRGRFAIGGQHKLAGVTGATYLFEVLSPLYRPIDQDVKGVVAVTITKDRPGYIRSHSPANKVGTLFLNATTDGVVEASMTPPTVKTETDEPSGNELVIIKAVVDVIRDLNEETPGKPPSQNLVLSRLDHIKAGTDKKRAAVEQALRLELIAEQAGERKARLFTYIKDLNFADPNPSDFA